jgi:FkbM family methyltransferase
MVEPMPRPVAELAARYGDDHRFSLVQAAVTDPDGTVDMHVVAGASLMSSVHAQVLVDGGVESFTTVSVPAVTYATLTAQLGHVDVLHIDAEGHDALILDQVELDDGPAVTMYESDHLVPTDRDRSEARLRAAGYHVCSNVHDTIAVRSIG